MGLAFPAWLDERPPAPSYFRILYLGKILQDDDSLIREYNLFFAKLAWSMDSSVVYIFGLHRSIFIIISPHAHQI